VRQIVLRFPDLALVLGNDAADFVAASAQRQDDNRLTHGLEAFDDGPQAPVARPGHSDARAALKAPQATPDVASDQRERGVAIARDPRHSGDNLDGREWPGRTPQGRRDGLG
jgi:hypothetical protein